MLQNKTYKHSSFTETGSQSSFIKFIICVLKTSINYSPEFSTALLQMQIHNYLIKLYIYDILEKADCVLFKTLSSMPNHPFYPNPSQKLKKALCTFEFQAANSLGLIPSA